jgi:hypothetical protein
MQMILKWKHFGVISATRFALEEAPAERHCTEESVAESDAYELLHDLMQVVRACVCVYMYVCMYVRLVDDVFGVSLQAPSLTYAATQCTEGAAIDISSSHSGGPVASFALVGTGPQWVSLDVKTGRISGSPEVKKQRRSRNSTNSKRCLARVGGRL